MESEHTTTFKLRLTHDLKDKISKSAEQFNRSMNADVVARLEQSFEKDILNFHNENEISSLEMEVNDLRELFKQSAEANKAYFQMIVDLLNKKNDV